MVSEAATGPFRIHDGGRIAGASERGLYACQLAHYAGQWYFLGTGDNGISDPYPVMASEEGLSIEPI